jgi:hypothetical protein
VTWLKGAKLEDAEDVLVTWIGQVNAKIGTGTDEIKRNKRRHLDSR